MAENTMNKSLIETELKKKLFLDLIKELQCLVCKTFPNAEIKSFYRCPKSHLICDQCFSDGKKCCKPDPCNGCTNVRNGQPQNNWFDPAPPCRARGRGRGCQRCQNNPNPVGQNALKPPEADHVLVKCVLTQTILDQWKLRVCINHKNGCNQIDSIENLLEHQIECYYRDIQCPHATCPKTFGLTTLIDHMKNDHFNVQGSVGMDFGTKTKMSQVFAPFAKEIPPKIITMQNMTFFEVWYKKENSMYFWIYFLGDPYEADRFQYHIHLKKAHGREITYFGKVKSINEEYESLLKDEDTFVSSMEVIERYRSPNLMLEYTLKIRNLKEEVKDENCESGIDDSD